MTSVYYEKKLAPRGAMARATEIAFCAMFLFLPLSKPLLYISSATAFALFFAGGGLQQARRHWRTQPWMAPALALASLPLLSLLVHGDALRGLSHLHLAYYWLFAFVACAAAASGMPVLPWLKAFLCGMFVAFCYSQASAAGWIAFSNEPSSMANYILYSQLLAMAIVLLPVLYRHERERRMKWLYLAAMALFFLGLVSGRGRSGMLAVLALLPFMFGNIFGHAHRRKILLASAATVLALLMSPQVQTRIEAAVSDFRLMRQEVTDTSLGYRLQMWEKAGEVIRAHPLIGSTPNGFREAWHSTPRSGEALAFVEPHNAFLFYASSYGLIGLAVLIWLYAALLWTGWRNRGSLVGGAGFAFAVVVVLGSLTNTMFLGAVSHSWLMLFIGLQGGLMRDEEV
jgi:O-antigen ligase